LNIGLCTHEADALPLKSYPHMLSHFSPRPALDCDLPIFASHKAEMTSSLHHPQLLVEMGVSLTIYPGLH
jgi:hypothetical protein